MIVASRRVLIPTNDQVPSLLGPAFDEVHAYVQSQAAHFAGPCFALWHSSPQSYTDEDKDSFIKEAMARARAWRVSLA